MFVHILQACSEMIMPFASSKNTSMFPAYDYDYTSEEELCLENFHVKPRPTWITTEFGGHVRKFCSSFKMFFYSPDWWQILNLFYPLISLLTSNESFCKLESNLKTIHFASCYLSLKLDTYIIVKYLLNSVN